MTNVLEYLEQTAPRVPEKIAIGSPEYSLTYGEIWQEAKAVGSFLHSNGLYSQSVVVFMKKSPRTIAAFLGVIYAGCYYVALDEEMPAHRIGLIFDTLKPQAVICDETTVNLLDGLSYTGARYLYSEISAFPVEEAALAAIREKQIDTDPIYIVFTSGSTGIPKGVTGCHRGVIDYIENLCPVLQPDEDSVFGNQTPLYFDAFFKEVFPAFRFGGTVWLIPRQLFMFPVKLVEFLNEYKINTVCWVVSALTMISSFGTFQKVKPKYLRTIAFASEVFPMKQFKLWREALPQARFINLYGPTECTGVCCYYVVDREFGPDETLPIGRPFRNTGILLLDENNREAAPGEQGEICVRGTCLTLGYYRNPEKTAEAFVQNPLNTVYPETIYRTGDIGRYNERGELEFLSRKDYQIKHMGHRIELGEIETALCAVEGVERACCLYLHDKGKILCYTCGPAQKAQIVESLHETLPAYMIPNLFRTVEAMPLNKNGKIDRNALMALYEKEKEARHG